MYKSKRVGVIIAAAGSGTRMGGGISKQYRKIAGREVLHHSLSAFACHPLVDDLFLAVKESDMEICLEKISLWGISKVRKVVPGGGERQDSVFRALEAAMKTSGGAPDLILIHDGARPFVSEGLITRVIEEAADRGAVAPGIPMKDTVKKAEGHWFQETLDRKKYFRIQTPQGFETELLAQAYEKARKDGYQGTDDASLIERLPREIRLVAGEEGNIKITTEEDIMAGEAILSNRQSGRADPAEAVGKEKLPAAPDSDLRIGSGFDVHAFAEGRPLMLGGVEIPYEKGLLGHSDADVLTHALMDALLGACGLSDIGEHFPDTDERYRGISSIRLLERVAEAMEEKGWQLINGDIILIAERPKIAPYKNEMRKNLAAALSVHENKINIKGTTTEKLGFCGREEGIAAQAVVLCRNLGGSKK